MDYNFNIKVKNIDGTERPDETLGKILAEFIGTEQKGKTIKLYGWMKTLSVNDPLQLDESDRADLEKLIEETDRMFVFVKGQILEILKAK